MLRKLEEKDIPFMLEWMHDKEINCNFQTPFGEYTELQARAFIENSFDNVNQHFAFVNDSDEYLGTISLKNISYQNDKAEYAIVARKSAQGTGAAKQATEDILKYAFDELKLHKIYLSVLEQNNKARHFYEKCGFIYEGTDIDSVKIGNRYYTHVWYAIINDTAHVSDEYFSLEKQNKDYSQAWLKIRFIRLKDKIVRLLKRVWRHFERQNYENGKYADKLKILTTSQTLELLETQKISFLRYGDGELALIEGSSIPFQEYNKELSYRLKELLTLKDDKIKVGIPYYYMCPVKNLNSFVESFAKSMSSQRRFLSKTCRKDMTYIDTCITQVYQTYNEYDFESYYKRMQKLLSGKDVTVICGEGILDKLENNALSVCKSIEYIYAPSMNAFSKYDDIVASALKVDKNRLICVVLGPTAKVLVYDLHSNGYQAWDMGHYFKDYDSYIKKRPRTEAEISQFYKPD